MRGQRGYSALESSVVSTPCLPSGEKRPDLADAVPRSSPSSICSRNTQRLPASRTASKIARPVAMWSAWLRVAPPQVSRKLLVMTISGRCRRNDHRSLDAAQPHTQTPRRAGRGSPPCRHRRSAPARAARPRAPPASSGSIPSMPASPLVTMAYTTVFPDRSSGRPPPRRRTQDRPDGPRHKVRWSTTHRQVPDLACALAYGCNGFQSGMRERGRRQGRYAPVMEMPSRAKS